MDRNNIIGIALMILLFVGYFAYNQYEETRYNEQLKQDSTAKAKLLGYNKSPVATPATPTKTDSGIAPAQPLAQAYTGTAQDITIANSKVEITLNTKGGFPTAARLKNYTATHQKPLYVFKGAGNKIDAILPYDNGRATSTLYFLPQITQKPDSTTVATFTADLGSGKSVQFIYTLAPNDYRLQYQMVLNGMPAQNIKMLWDCAALRTEPDIAGERQNTQNYYKFKDGDYDYFTAKTNEEKLFSAPKSVSWIGFRKQHFATALIAEEGFAKLDNKTTIKEADTNITAVDNMEAIATMRTAGNQSMANFTLYVGPNEYNTLNAYKNGMEEMVPLGVGMFSFVKYINKFLIVPLFYFLVDHVNNMALVIVLLTLIVRVFLSFFTYTSFVSSAKMRVLKPEMDALRAQIGDDQQKFSMEQMKLYRSAGVNPLGGCIPMLFQLPVLMSVYYMFPSFLQFRQQGFLWATDLACYDSIFNFGLNIPLLGDHISLFTLTMTATNLFLSYYNRNAMQADPNNPMLQYMPYIFPFFLFGMFNRSPAALTFYYTLSNFLSFTQQFVIQKFFIDEKAIHAQMQENKNKPPATSKWQQKLEEMQRLQAAQNKPTPKKNK